MALHLQVDFCLEEAPRRLKVDGLIVLGVPGSTKTINEVVNVTGVLGEMGDVSVVLPEGTDYLEKVDVNGQNVTFSKGSIGISKALTIAGIHIFPVTTNRNYMILPSNEAYTLPHLLFLKL